MIKCKRAVVSAGFVIDSIRPPGRLTDRFVSGTHRVVNPATEI